MQVGVQRRSEAVDERHRPETRPVGGIGTAGSQRRFDLGEEDPQHRVDQRAVVMDKIAQPFRQRKHPLPHRHLGKHVIHQVCRSLGHAAGGA